MIVHNEDPDKPKTLPAGTQVHRQGERQDLRLQGPGRSSSGRRRSLRHGRPASSPCTRRGSAASMSRPRSGQEVRDGHRGQLPGPRPEGRGRPERLRHRAEARPRQEGLPGHQGGLRVRPGGREVHHRRPDERGPLVPDAHHPRGRQGPRPSPASTRSARSSRARTRSTTRRRRSGSTGRSGASSRPTPRSSSSTTGKLFYSGLQRRIRAGRRRPRPRRLGPEDQQVREDPRAERPEAAGDVRDGACCRPRRTSGSW